MTASHYSLVRFLADPARNEPVNVGILAWDEQGVKLRLDHEALSRVYRLNPNVTREAIDHVDELLESSIVARWQDAPDPSGLLAAFRKPPVLLTEPTWANGNGTAADLDAVVERLLRRLVRVVPRSNGRVSKTRALTFFNRRFKQQIDEERIDTDKDLRAESGLTLAVNFYANSGANVALDVVNLAIQPTKVQERVYAEAGKAHDLLWDRGEVRELIVFCAPSLTEESEQAVATAKAVIGQVKGATVVVDREEAAERFESLIRR